VCAGLAEGKSDALLIAVAGGIQDYFREINAASSHNERTRIGERYSIRVVPGGPA